MRLVGIQAEALGGSFHEEAARLYYGADLEGIDLIPVKNHAELLRRFQDGAEFDEIVTAVDNTISGRVTSSINALRDHSPDYYVAGCITIPVVQKLLVHPQADPSTITHVISQTPALEQCDKNIVKSGYTPVHVGDTLGAAMILAAQKGIINGNVTAAIASGLAAQTTGLDILHPSFNDSPHNATKFWVVHPLQKGQEQEGTHTAITFEVPDAAGGLRAATNILRKQGVNITDIDSHLAPTGTRQRAFFAELEEHNGTVGRALKQMRLKGLAPVILGSYTPISYQPDLTVRSKQLPQPSNKDWHDQKGLNRPARAETLYVLTDHRIGALDKVLSHLVGVNIIDLTRPHTPNDTDFNRGFNLVLDPKADKTAIRTAVSNIEREGYFVERIPPIKAPQKVK